MFWLLQKVRTVEPGRARSHRSCFNPLHQCLTPSDCKSLTFCEILSSLEIIYTVMHDVVCGGHRPFGEGTFHKNKPGSCLDCSLPQDTKIPAGSTALLHPQGKV